MSTAIESCSATIRRVASRPSKSGIWMSISTTSGVRRRADDADAGLALEDRPEPCPYERLVIGDQHRDDLVHVAGHERNVVAGGRGRITLVTQRHKPRGMKTSTTDEE